MKRLLAIIMFVAMLTGLFAGCGKQSTDGQKTESTQSVEQKTDTGDKIDNVEVKEEQKPVQITFMHWRNEDKEAYKKIYEKFKQAEPNISISEEIVPGPDFKTVLQTRLAGGAAPDMFGINGIETYGPMFNDAGYLEYLNDVEELKLIPDKFHKVCTDAKGNQYAVVWSVVNFGLFYNQDIFTQAGVQKPGNWNEFLDLCQKLKDKGITPISVGGKDANTLYWLVQCIAANEQYAKDPEAFVRINEGKAKFSDLTAFRSTLEKFETLIEKGYITQDVLGVATADSITLFSQGKAAMLVGGCFTAPGILSANTNIKIGAIAVPGDNGESNLFGVNGMTYAINKAASDDAKKAAKEFLKFMLNVDVSKEFSEATRMFSTLKGIEMQYSDTASIDFASKSGDSVLITLFNPKAVSANYNKEFYSDLQALVAGKTTIDQILKNQDALIGK